MATLDMDEIVRHLNRVHGIHAFVDHTGGGTVTIYAGAFYTDPDDSSIAHWMAAAGPGWFTGPGRSKPVADTDEFDIGPGGDVHARECVRLTAHATERTAAAIIAAFARPGLGLQEQQIRAVGGNARRHAAYVAAVEAAMDPEGVRAEVDRYFTSVCPQCDSVADHRDGVHVMVDHAWEDTTVLAIGCEGYWAIDPNVVGIHDPNWHNSSGEVQL